MYFLPLFINNRRIHYCRIVAAESKDVPVPFRFIAEQEEGYSPVIFKLLREGAFLSRENKDSDISLRDRKLTCLIEMPHEDELVFNFFTQKDVGSRLRTADLNDQLKGNPITVEEEDGNLLFKYDRAAPSIDLKLSIRLDLGEAEEEEPRILEGGAIIHLYPQESIFDASFDFGSEASQLGYRQRGMSDRGDLRFNILDRLYHDFFLEYANERGGKTFGERFSHEDFRDFYQFEAEDQHLYNSRFFIRQKYGSEGEEDESQSWDEQLPKAPFTKGHENPIHILAEARDDSIVHSKEKAAFRQIPNLKLSELGFIHDFKLIFFNKRVEFKRNQKVIFRRLLNQFLHILLKEIDTYFEAEGKCLKLYLLVPNIYSQDRIYELLSDLYDDFNKINEGKKAFAGLEVQTVSESDASFLGLLGDSSATELNVHDLGAGGEYLIIDAGKGTMDVSIISSGEGRGQIGSRFRGGFAGSGNAITYAFLETIAACVAGPKESERKKFIQSVIHADLYWQNKFLNCVEQFKRSYSTSKKGVDRVSLEEMKELELEGNAIWGNSELPLDVLVEILEKKIIDEGKTIDDYFGIIAYTLRDLIQGIVACIRSSHLSNFKKAVLSGRGFKFLPLKLALEQKLMAEFEVGEVLLYPDKLKTSCLYGPLNFFGGTNMNSDMVGTPVFETMEYSQMDQVKSAFGIKGVKPKEVIYSKEIDPNAPEFYIQGFDIDISNHRISISGRELRIPSSFSEEKECNLLFTGDAFFLRTQKECRKLSLSHEASDSPWANPLAWKSLFPNVEPGSVMVTGIKDDPALFNKPEKVASEDSSPILPKTEKLVEETQPAPSIIPESMETNLDEKKPTEDEFPIVEALPKFKPIAPEIENEKVEEPPKEKVNPSSDPELEDLIASFMDEKTQGDPPPEKNPPVPEEKPIAKKGTEDKETLNNWFNKTLKEKAQKDDDVDDILDFIFKDD